MRGWRRIGLWIALALVAGAATAASVVKEDQSSVCGTYTSVTVNTSGMVTLFGCSTTWTGATFALSADTTTTTSGTTVNLMVTRTGGSFPPKGGSLILTLVPSPSSSLTSPPTFTFGANDLTQSGSVTFNTVTTATSVALSLSANATGNTLPATPLSITVNPSASTTWTGATFALSADTTTTTSGTTVNLMVTRTGGSFPPNSAPLILTLVPSPPSSLTSPPTFTFGANDLTQSGSVKFNTVTTATSVALSLSANATGNTLPATPLSITVNPSLPTWSGATFTLTHTVDTTVSPTTATVTTTSGTGNTLTVTRRGGSFPAGGAPLTLTLLSDPSSLVSTPLTFTFGANDSTQLGRVTFKEVTTATPVALSLSASASGNTLPATPLSITLSPCSQFTRPYTVVDMGSLSLIGNTQDPGNNRVLPGNSSAPTSGAFKFTVPSQTTIDTANPYSINHYFVVMETTSLAASHTRSFGVSQCAGEYQPTATGCYVIGGPLMAWGSNLPSYECQVQPGQSYYFNIMAWDNGVPLKGVSDGFVLKVLPSP